MVSAANFCGKQIEIAKRARKPALPKATNEYINKYNNLHYNGHNGGKNCFYREW